MAQPGPQDVLLNQINERLAPLEEAAVRSAAPPRQPTLFVVGLPRSGSTLLTQFLANHTNIGFVSNFAARFWRAPATAIALQRTIFGPGAVFGYDSRYGATGEPLAPHEFGFFWRRWFAYGDSHALSDAELKQVDGDGLARQLGAIEAALGAPIMYKNLAACGMNAAWLAELLPRAIFLVCRRSYEDVALSLALGRVRYHGNVDDWFSVKPPEYTDLAGQPVPEQIAGQILGIERRLSGQLAGIDTARWAVVEYADLCRDPARVLAGIVDLLGRHGGALGLESEHLPEPFEARRPEAGPGELPSALIDAITARACEAAEGAEARAFFGDARQAAE